VHPKGGTAAMPRAKEKTGQVPTIRVKKKQRLPGKQAPKVAKVLRAIVPKERLEKESTSEKPAVRTRGTPAQKWKKSQPRRAWYAYREPGVCKAKGEIPQSPCKGRFSNDQQQKGAWAGRIPRDSPGTKKARGKKRGRTFPGLCVQTASKKEKSSRSSL